MTWWDACPGSGTRLPTRWWGRLKVNGNGITVKCPRCGRWFRPKQYRKTGRGRIGIPAHKQPANV